MCAHCRAACTHRCTICCGMTSHGHMAVLDLTLVAFMSGHSLHKAESVTRVSALDAVSMRSTVSCRAQRTPMLPAFPRG
eukprot:9503998-Pyramimonas_sp.AAC.3